TGHEEVNFPLLIPKTEFAKEAEHIKGFDAEVYWVTRGGVNELDVPMLLRPTSETAMYPMFALWVRSHTDLPLKTFQIVNTFRYETKMTRAFMRVREIHFFEAHTCHADEADAERQIAQDLEVARNYFGAISLPYVLTRRPDWDKFPGAHYSLGADALMPSGRTLQVGTFHQYLDNFARPYGITYEAEGGEHRNVYQTTYGMSERVLGALVGVHGDERGIVLPPAVAPIQVVIVPIVSKKGADVLAYCAGLKDSLRLEGIRAHIDDRDLRPGNRYYHWEKRGVPLRLEIGPREVASGEASLARRDLPVGEGKATVRLEGIAVSLRDELDAFASRLMARAAAALEAGIHAFDDLRDATPEGIVKLGWCGGEECGHGMEEHLDMTMLGVWLDDDMTPREERRCAVCGQRGSAVLLARTY
ncbi:MAG: proline--tRNA ligase, partial [Thermoplasmata archaeon]|nr:proline--tRNA ligase [Thermoplasmata archaeon]